MQAVVARPALRGIDTIQVLTATDCANLKAAGVDFVGRYLQTLTAEEIQRVLGAGLMMTFFSYSRAPGWIPDGSVGQQDGQVAVLRARALQIPTSCTLWCDFEGPGGTVGQKTDYLGGQGRAIFAGGYTCPGLYVGYGTGLTSQELQAAPHVRYCHACSRLVDRSGQIEEPSRGFSLIQCYPPNQTCAGIEIDWEFTQNDYLGAGVVLLAA